MTNKEIGKRKNTLLRYKSIKEVYNKTVADNPYMPLTVVYRLYIFPVFFISKTTLYTILCTPITSELIEIDKQLLN